MGALPSQHPPERWNMMGPCCVLSSSMSARAASETPTLSFTGLSSTGSISARPPSEEAQRLGAVAHQHVLGLLVVIEHHLVRLAPDARFLVAAERGMRGIGVVAIGPHASRLDAAAQAVCKIDVARPHTGPEAVERVVGDFERLLGRVESRHRHHRPEDLLLEDAHLVVALEHSRLDVVT